MRLGIADQGIEQAEQAIQRTAILLHDPESLAADGRGALRIGEQFADRVRQPGRVVDHAARTEFHEHIRDLLCVIDVRADDDRQTQRGGLQQVVAADRHQAAPDERRIARGIKQRDLAHRVAEEDIRRSLAG